MKKFPVLFAFIVLFGSVVSSMVFVAPVHPLQPEGRVFTAKDGSKWQLVEANGQWAVRGIKGFGSNDYYEGSFETCDEAKAALEWWLNYVPRSKTESFNQKQARLRALPWKVSDCDH